MSVVGGWLKQKMASRRQRRIEKVMVGLGSRECKAGYDSDNCGKFRVRWRGLCALGRVPEYMRVKAGVANRTWPIQDIERDGESRIMSVQNSQIN